MDSYYKSPTKKLVVFFEKSRNQWKEKTLATKLQLKIAKNRIKFLESSKNELKIQLKMLREESKKLEMQIKATSSMPIDNNKKSLD
jgi:hypothetical protein